MTFLLPGSRIDGGANGRRLVPWLSRAMRWTTAQKTQGRTNLGAAPAITTISNVLGADVLLNNTANYFDGPNVAQGTVGTWFVTGSITLSDAVAAAPTFFAKLWDGTTLIATTVVVGFGTAAIVEITLSGIITSPVGNLRISARDSSSVNGIMNWSATGLGKDSSIFAMRIA